MRNDVDGDGLFRPLLPPAVLVAQMDPRQADPAAIHPDERLQVQCAVEGRRREFAAGRLLARSLLSSLGAGTAPLINGPDRAPVWPPGIVGSIAHCPSLCAVAVGKSPAIFALGIDVEPAIALPDGVANQVLSAVERGAIARLPTALQPVADRLIFSAKEATYKALYPSTRHFLDFADLHVELGAAGDFIATVTRPVPFARTQIRGRYRIDGLHMATAVVLRP